MHNKYTTTLLIHRAYAILIDEMQPKPTDEHVACAPREILLQAAMMRLGHIEKEIQAGYNIIRKFHKTVTFFGSARTPEGSKYYEAAEELALRLAGKGYAVVSGGGNGIMSAANEGAHTAVQKGATKAGGASVAFNIKLPHEQALNPYATDTYEFKHFAPRKIVMTLFAEGYVYFPGGFGTLDELTEILTLIQTGKTQKAPIILFGREFWQPFDDFIQHTLLADGMIAPGDEKLYIVTDSYDKVIDLIEQNTTYCSH